MAIFGFGKKTSEKELEARLKKLNVVCPKCKTEEKGKHAFSQLFVCEKCGAYMTVGARERIHMVADKGSFEPWFNEEEESNPLNHAEYPDKLKAAREKSSITNKGTKIRIILDFSSFRASKGRVNYLVFIYFLLKYS